LAPDRRFRGPADPRIARAVCIAAHPDDVDFFAGGTVLLMSGRGVAVDLVVVTSGDKGTRDPARAGAELAAAREGEQRASAALLGVARVEFLRQPDSQVVDDLELRGLLVREIRRSRPDVLLTFSPMPDYRQHPDHRAVGRAAMDAAWPCARDPLTYPDAGPAHETAEAWLFGGPRHHWDYRHRDLRVDVSKVLDVKIQARLEHRSQTPDPAALAARWRRTGRDELFVQVDLR
jgi:LmbE family N-acetylglucosaminyl deacetylase